MKNKTALVTGGSDGVGLSVVRALIAKNYDVHFIGSNKQKGEKLEAELKAKAKVSEVHFTQLDLSDLKAVKAFADSFSKQVSQLDVLLFSAGVLLPKRSETAEGIEKTFTIGYLSAYVLSKAFQPLLEKAEHPRVLTVSGGAPLVLKERLKFDDLNLENNYSAPVAAMRTVHAKVVLTQHLAEQWAEKGIDSNTFHPGIVKGGLGRNLPWPLNIGFKAAAQFMPKDSETGIHACLSDSLTGVSGKFLYKEKQIPLKFSDDYKNTLIEKTEAMLVGIL